MSHIIWKIYLPILHLHPIIVRVFLALDISAIGFVKFFFIYPHKVKMAELDPRLEQDFMYIFVLLKQIVLQ